MRDPIVLWVHIMWPLSLETANDADVPERKSQKEKILMRLRLCARGLARIM